MRITPSNQSTCQVDWLLAGFDYGLRDIRGYRLIVVKLHGVSGAAFGHGTKSGNVTEHFGKRYFGVNDLVKSALPHILNLGALGRKGPRNITDKFLRRYHFPFHKRFENN